MKQNRVLPYWGNRFHSKNGFGRDCSFPNGQLGLKMGAWGGALTLHLSISAVLEWLAFRDWGSVWSQSVKTYTPAEGRKMKDILSLCSTSPITVRPSHWVWATTSQNMLSSKSAYSSESPRRNSASLHIEHKIQCWFWILALQRNLLIQLISSESFPVCRTAAQIQKCWAVLPLSSRSLPSDVEVGAWAAGSWSIFTQFLPERQNNGCTF